MRHETCEERRTARDMPPALMMCVFDTADLLLCVSNILTTWDRTDSLVTVSFFCVSYVSNYTTQHGLDLLLLWGSCQRKRKRGGSGSQASGSDRWVSRVQNCICIKLIVL